MWCGWGKWLDAGEGREGGVGNYAAAINPGGWLVGADASPWLQRFLFSDARVQVCPLAPPPASASPLHLNRPSITHPTSAIFYPATKGQTSNLHESLHRRKLGGANRDKRRVNSERNKRKKRKEKKRKEKKNNNDRVLETECCIGACARDL